MIYFSVVVSALSLGVKAGVGTSGNSEDCAMGGEGWVGKVSGCCGGSWISSGGSSGGLASVLTWGWCYLTLGM
jgi:hypothetical protein